MAIASSSRNFTSDGLPTLAPEVITSPVVARRTAAIVSPISRISSAPMPSVVTAALPSRSPLVYQAPLVSSGTTFRFKVMPADRSAASACRPFSPKGRTSTSTRWLSVPPVTTETP